MTLDRRPVTRLFPLTIFFAADGVLFATWVVRVPAIKEQVGASATALGFALLCMTAGVAASMYAGGALCERLGTRLVMVATFPLVAAGLVLPALTRTPVQLGAVLLVLGLTYGILIVALNAAAVEVETATGQAIMSPMHGLWSLGGLVGAVIGGLLAERLSTLAHLGMVAALLILVVGAASPAMLGARRRSSGAAVDLTGAASVGASAAGEGGAPASAPGTGRRVLSLAVVLFGVVALCTAYGEGAVGDWAALHLREDLAATAGLASYGFGAYSVAIAAGRLGGGWIINRVGVTVVLTGGALLAAIGILVAAWATTVPVAFAGLVVVGLGLANMFPIAIARAGAVGGSRGVGLASAIGTTGMVAGPPVIGFLADQVGLPAALSTVAVLAGVAGVLGIALRRYAAPTGAASVPARDVEAVDAAVEGAQAAEGTAARNPHV